MTTWWIKTSLIRLLCVDCLSVKRRLFPDYAALHPGYLLVMPVSVAGATIMAVKALNKDDNLADKNKSDPLIVR